MKMVTRQTAVKQNANKNSLVIITVIIILLQLMSRRHKKELIYQKPVNYAESQISVELSEKVIRLRRSL